MKVPLNTLFLANSGGFSSKRVAGLFGWLVCLIVFILSYVSGKPVPDFGDIIIITSTSLLGVSSLENIFQKRVNK